MAKLSQRFTELWSNPERSLDINKYEECLNEWKKAHEGKMIKHYFLTLLFFAIGIVWVYYEQVIPSIIFFALTLNSNTQSQLHILSSELMDNQRLLGMLINHNKFEK